MRDRSVWVGAIVVFGYGVAVHAYELLTRGLDAYADFPAWLQGYFAVLIVLDTAAATLIALRLRVGLAVGCAVLITDALANGFADYVLDPDPGFTFPRLGQAIITALAVGMVFASRRLWRSFR